MAHQHILGCLVLYNVVEDNLTVNKKDEKKCRCTNSNPSLSHAALNLNEQGHQVNTIPSITTLQLPRVPTMFIIYVQLDIRILFCHNARV